MFDMKTMEREATKAFCTEAAPAPGQANARLKVPGAAQRTESGGLQHSLVDVDVFAHWSTYDQNAIAAGLPMSTRVAYIVGQDGLEVRTGGILTIGGRAMEILRLVRTPYDGCWIAGGD